MEEPRLVLRSLARAEHTNLHGGIFGGWLVSQLDAAAALFVRDITDNKCVTVAMDKILFLKPVSVGQIVSTYATLINKGNSSLTIQCDLMIDSHATLLRNDSDRRNAVRSLCTDSGSYKAVQGIITYVAVDDQGRPTTVILKQ